MLKLRRPRAPRLDVRIIAITMLLTVMAIGVIFFSIWALSIAGSRMAKAHTIEWHHE